MKSTRSARAALSQALFDVLFHTKLLNHQLAARLSVSRRTFARYLHQGGFPEPARAHAMLWELATLPPEIYHRLGDALGIEPHRRPPQPGAPGSPTSVAPIDRAVEEASIRLMLYTVAETTHVDPQVARSIALGTLEYIAVRGLDLATAHDLVRTVARVKK